MRSALTLALLLSALLLTTRAQTCAAAGFAWEDGEGVTNLSYDGRPVLQLVHPAFDDSSAESIQKTFKPFHHVYTPDGSTQLSKGPGGLFPHHRGLFFGFNKVTYHGDKACDVWHCTNGAHQKYIKEIHREADDAHGMHSVAIDWYGAKDVVFAHEIRDLGVRRGKAGGVDGWIIDFASHVTTADGQPIHLDGDPQHAGFHFRADQEDIKNTDQKKQEAEKHSYFLRTDGKGQENETRNWDPKKQDSKDSTDSVNRPWDAMSFELHGKRYTVLYLDHPSNPKPARYSERAYGRMGSYFVTDVTTEKPLNVKYRVWIQEGDMSLDQCAKMSADFNAEGTVLPSTGLILPREGEQRSSLSIAPAQPAVQGAGAGK